MAQRLIHYLIGEKLLSGVLSDVFSSEESAALFRLGHLLPDAYSAAADAPLRRRTHFICELGDGRLYSDFEAFRRRFAEKIPANGLYFGYYLHLIEDARFRTFFRAQQLDEAVRTAKDVSFLHRDYHILNGRLTEKYGLRAEPIADVSIAAEPIADIHDFDTAGLIRSVSEDLAERTEGATMYFTEAMADEFIALALPDCEKAARRILGGQEPTDPFEYIW